MLGSDVTQLSAGVVTTEMEHILLLLPCWGTEALQSPEPCNTLQKLFNLKKKTTSVFESLS